MQSYPTRSIRNIILSSHSGTGKTSLVEAFLYKTGSTTRLGRVEDGNTVSDFEPEETKRHTSVDSAIVPVEWQGSKLNLIDTPGYTDFLGEVISGLRVADAAVLLVAAPVGVEVGTEQLWRFTEARSLPRVIVVNKMDRENADFDRSVESIRRVLGRKCVSVQIPIGAQHDFQGLVDVLNSADAPEELQGVVETAKEQLVEAVAETDDELATKYLEEEGLSDQELQEGLKKAILTGELVPILVASATQMIGIEQALDMLVNYLPSPLQAPGHQNALPEATKAPLAACVFKTTADPYVGKLSYFRVYRGSLASDTQVWNTNKQQAERVAQIFVPRGKSQEQAAQLEEGDIGAVAKLTVTGTGDSLCLREAPVELEGITFPESVFTMAVYPKSKQDLDKMTMSLNRLVEEDPSLAMSREAQTAETLLSGLGESHLEVAVEKARRKFGVELTLQLPKVPYLETIARQTKVEYKHKKQTGGHGQYGHVFLELEPASRGEGFEFGSRIVGGAVPREYVPSVGKGVHKALEEGSVAGYPVVDVKVTLYDGSFHPVDSSGMSFEIASSFAMRKGLGQATPTILEPVYSLSITVPDSYAGDVMGDLNGRRGRILGMTPQGDGTTLIEAEAPQAEVQRYAMDLRSITQSRGEFRQAFSHYEEVPQHLVERITEQAKREREAARV